MVKMKKIMFYCQYLTGMGHLVRSTEIARALAKHFRVYFINGGPPVEGFEIPPQVELISLPALWSEDGKFEIPAGCRRVEKVKERRKNLLIEAFDRVKPDCLITEFFPFGRHKLFFELVPLLKHIKSTAPATKIACSLRDVIGRETLAQEADTICELVNLYFDLILFHADPRFQSFAESFPRHQELDCKIHYTGFVAQSPRETISPEDDELLAGIDKDNPLILTSVGGGRLGYELLEAIIAASPILEQRIPHRIQIFTGPFLPEEQFLQLQQMAAECQNVNLRRYTPQLIKYMEKADLSISLTGYNTTMNILRTGVRALVVPIGHYEQDREQLVRTNKLEQMGVVEVINPQQLMPTDLARRILASLNKPPVANANTARVFDLQGVQKTTAFLQEFLQSKVSTAAQSI